MAPDALAGGAATNAAVPVAGVRQPGRGRLRFCRAEIADADLGAWVAVLDETGEQAGRIVVAPQQIMLGEPPPLASITRQLSPDEIRRVAELDERARGEMDRAIELVRGLHLPLFITGLRYTLDAQAALIPYRGPRQLDSALLAATLAGQLSTTVHLEWEGELEPLGVSLFGGLGRLRESQPSLDELIRRRFVPLSEPPAFAPEGLPRLGSHVQSPGGSGTILSISTKRREARLRLDSGDEIVVPLDDIVSAG